jgi:hypothetical protein
MSITITITIDAEPGAVQVRTGAQPPGATVPTVLGGPEVLTWADTVELFSRVLHRPINASYTPAGVFRFMQWVLTPFSRSAASVMGTNWLVARSEMAPPDPTASSTAVASCGSHSRCHRWRSWAVLSMMPCAPRELRATPVHRRKRSFATRGGRGAPRSRSPLLCPPPPRDGDKGLPWCDFGRRDGGSTGRECLLAMTSVRCRAE